KKHSNLIDWICEVLGSRWVENAFKNRLCHRLAEFYSIHTLLYRIQSLFPADQFIFYPRVNVQLYQDMKNLVEDAGGQLFEIQKFRLSWRSRWISWIENAVQEIYVLLIILVQWGGSLLLLAHKKRSKKPVKDYQLAILVIAPQRQLNPNQRRADFLVDDRKVFSKDTIYFTQTDLTEVQKEALKNLGNSYAVPRAKDFFGGFTWWNKLLGKALLFRNLLAYEEIKLTYIVLSRYLIWKEVLSQFRIGHFVTHCDFGAPHIGRNIALQQAGVQTWYFTDAVNYPGLAKTNPYGKPCRHPFWTYLTYDHFVTWADFAVNFFSSHPQSIQNYHVVGCLWASCFQTPKEENKPYQKEFLIAVFDTGYTLNGDGCFEEGIAFAKDILKLADDFPDSLILFKQKFAGPEPFLRTDQVLGRQLVEEYQKMQSHPRIKFLSHEKSPAEVIGMSDLTVSFPFTSTTFEALSMNKFGLWHDPCDLYRNSMYGRTGELTTHGYAQLKNKIAEIKDKGTKNLDDIFYANPELFDPYHDGKALERFQDLLLTET
ncbi:MAG: polysaccharide biosynthesis PFTS motif protein, partial [Candidatus Omnitrophica bacterium]|nr:polysaccharide biosynthesis PFTS motif protein [Candidatus Omnitrophota bacterium]